MSEQEKDSVQGLTCPKCGGMVPIPEGQIIVQCPYCELRSLVRGERGMLRYQVPQRVPRQNAIQALSKFFSSSMAIARDTAQKARLDEAFLVHIPFWTVWARVAAWVFGEKKVGSGDKKHYEPREMRVVQEMSWSGAACDVGEFGVKQISVAEQGLQPFNPDEMHSSGMVFEPVGSVSDARASADKQFEEQVRKKAGLDRLAQMFIRVLRQRFALVYYPMWVLRYLYRGRSFQVVVDANSGEVLYGKAPGNTLYRAAVLILGMAAGAFISVDVTALLVYFLSDSNSNGDAFWLVLVSFVVGLGLMYAAYRSFRYGEQYEYRRGGGDKKIAGIENPLEGFSLPSSITSVKDVEEWINRLT
jgi:hypothetical protein